ncbi:LPS assembly protein LptD [Pseudomonadales bacterium]|nr:LPS assembly protein LptD [Pseudomonadales bacterium]
MRPKLTSKHAPQALCLLLCAAAAQAGQNTNISEEDDFADDASTSIINHQAPTTNIDHRNLAHQDWQSEDSRSNYCGGGYINPINANPVNGNSINSNSQPASDQEALPIEASAGSTTMQESLTVFEHNVLVTQGDISLQADKATYAAESEKLELNGNVVVRSSDAAFGGSSASVNINQNSSIIRDANYIVHQQHIRGNADKISADAKGNIQIDHGSYTQCSPDSNLWQLDAGKITLDKESGQGKARHAKLKIKNVPVAYIPYAQFPIGEARQSGLLFPSISDSSSGIDITLPYYLNLATNIDATLAPRYNAERGYITEAEGRWLNRFDQWVISGAYVNNDSVFAEDENSSDGRRWVIDIKEQGQFAKYFFSRINFTRISDNDYLRDLNTTSLSVNRTTHLNQRAALNFYGDHWTGGLNIQQYQTLDKNNVDIIKPFEKTPELWLGYQSSAIPFHIGGNAHLRHTAFEHDELASGARSFGEFNINYPMQWGGIRLAPSIGVQHLTYDLDDNFNALNDSPAITAPQAQLKFDMVFEKNSAARRTLEPGIFYVYRDADDQSALPLFDTGLTTINRNQLTRNSAFSGYDRLEDTHQAAVYLTHRHFNARGHETLAATIGQINYFEDVSTTNNTLTNRNSDSDSSAVITDIEATLGNRWQSHISALWDSNDNELEEGSFSLRYRSGGYNTGENSSQRNSTIANLGYHYRQADNRLSLLEADIEQADLSFVTALSSRWAIIGRYQFDTTQNRNNESLAGIEYNDCCIKLRVIYRDGLVYRGAGRDNERDRSIFLQIELKGLFGIGNALENILDESILGYRSLSGSSLNSQQNSQHSKHNSF